MTDQKNFAGKFHLWFNIIMIAVYTVCGVLLLFILRFESLPALNTKMIGGVLLLYASYRGYKTYKTSHTRTDSDPSNAGR
jgi:hypothetical protein